MRKRRRYEQRKWGNVINYTEVNGIRKKLNCKLINRIIYREYTLHCQPKAPYKNNKKKGTR